MRYHEHTAERPSWVCYACQEPWPCEPARLRLAKTHSPTQLAMLMWAELEAAAGDLSATPVGEMFDRFIRWTWQPSA